MAGFKCFPGFLKVRESGLADAEDSPATMPSQSQLSSGFCKQSSPGRQLSCSNAKQSSHRLQCSSFLGGISKSRRRK